MGASDYMTGNAPGGGSYVAPLVGFQLGQMLSQLPEQYMKGRENAQRIAADAKYPNAFDVQGRQNARTIEAQDAFKDGPPYLKDRNGNVVKDRFGNPMIDTNSIVNTEFKLGGAEYAKGLMPYLFGQNAAANQGTIDNSIENFGRAPAGASPGGAPSPAAAPASPRIVTPAGPGAHNPAASGPANITPWQPRGDDNGSDTVRSIAAELGGPSRDLAKAIPNYARAVGAGPDDPLTPQQIARAKQIIAKHIETRSGDSAEDQNGANAAPFMAGGVSGAPGPAASGGAGPAGVPGRGAPAVAAAPGAPGPSAGGAGGVQPRGGNGPDDLPTDAATLRAVASVLPPGVKPESYPGYVQALNRAVQATLSNAEQATLLPNGQARATSLMEKAKQYAAIRDKILDAAKAAAEPTGGMKEWLADRRGNEGLIEYEARRKGAEEGAVAPYRIAAAAVREGGRPVAVHPNEVVTTGGTLDPNLHGITGWATQRLGIPGAGEGGAASAAAGEAPPAGQSAFTPRMIRNPDGSVTSNVTPSTEKLQSTAAQNYEKARETYNGAQQTQQTLALMDDSFRKLNQTGWSSTGAGAEARLNLAKAVNSVWQVLGVKGEDLPFNPETIASWEDLTKNSTRLGFALSRTLGAREAMQVVQGAIKANPSVANTPIGARMVMNTIRASAERDSEYFEYATRYAQTHGGDLVGAEVAFNKAYPPTMYARRAIVQAQKNIPQEAIDYLRDDPALAGSFDKKFGQGSAKLFAPQGAR